MNILFYEQGLWIGDTIMFFNLIQSLKYAFKNCTIWYLCQKASNDPYNTSLKEYGFNIKKIPNKIDDFGTLWIHTLQINKAIQATTPRRFDLVISMSRKIKDTLCLRQIPTSHFYATTWGFRLCKPRDAYKKHAKLEIATTLENIAAMLKTPIQLRRYCISQIDKKLFHEAYRLLPNDRYIGFGVTQGNPPAAYRSWPITRFISIAKKISTRGYTPVFLIEASRHRLIRQIQRELPQAIFPESKSILACPALVTTLVTRLDAVVTIDTGIMHMAGLTKTPIVGIFGHTEPHISGWHINNLHPVDSKVLHSTINAHTITESDVLSQLNKVLQQITANKKTHHTEAYSH
jgi:ADP-heptose:LPS heptosyltransferase